MANHLHAPEELLSAQRLAHLTDSKVRIPFLKVSIGLDFLIGLVPLVGDFIMLLVSFRIVLLANKMKVPKIIRKKMVRNILIDFFLGLLPVIGDVVDLFYKANQTNVRLMETWWVAKNHQHIKARGQQLFKQWEQDNS